MDGFSTEKSAFCALPMYGQNGNHIIFLAIKFAFGTGTFFLGRRKKLSRAASGLWPKACPCA